MSTCDELDLMVTLISQSARTFGVALECHEVLANIQSRNKALVDKLASAEEELKKIKS